MPSAADPVAEPAAEPDHGHAAALAADRVADAVRERIIQGDLRSGTALREAGIAAGLKVSRNSVREGFRLLAREGLVVHEQHRGVRVRVLAVADITDIYLVRRTVELLGLPHVGAGQLRPIVAAAGAAAAVGDWRAVSTADLRFHQQIAAAAGSPRLDAMFLRVLAELRLAFAALPDGRSFHAPYLARNVRIIELLDGADGADVAGARAELEDYLRTAEAEVAAALSA